MVTINNLYCLIIKIFLITFTIWIYMIEVLYYNLKVFPHKDWESLLLKSFYFVSKFLLILHFIIIHLLHSLYRNFIVHFEKLFHFNFLILIHLLRFWKISTQKFLLRSILKYMKINIILGYIQFDEKKI
jgi:hypothetical protein